jgi:hypothetical protein
VYNSVDKLWITVYMPMVYWVFVPDKPNPEKSKPVNEG